MVRGLSLTFTSVTRHHSGFYTCAADNGFSDVPATATLILDVQRTNLLRLAIKILILFCLKMTKKIYEFEKFFES